MQIYDTPGLYGSAEFITGSTGDIARITSDAVLLNRKHFIDTGKRKALAHEDELQFIPTMVGMPWMHYALGDMKDCMVASCSFYSPNWVQGITGFDGLFINCSFTGNDIETQSDHPFHFNGLLSGIITNNTCDSIRLYPARVAGGLEGLPQIWVIGFASGHQYNGINLDRNHSPVRIDTRTERFNDTDIFLTNFRLNRFRSAAVELQQQNLYTSAEAYCLAIHDLAQEFGRHET